VYVFFTVVVRRFVDLLFALVVDFLVVVVVVLAAGVVVEPLLEPLLFSELLMIARRATITAISAKGAKKRAGLLLVR